MCEVFFNRETHEKGPNAQAGRSFDIMSLLSCGNMRESVAVLADRKSIATVID